ncbi:hypothetical protein B0H13DRAFT_2390173 [Mycena leptocephala]|nr:hypothetical protein B0H13DRAFT_2390173 [Mycena leptocephala]
MGWANLNTGGASMELPQLFPDSDNYNDSDEDESSIGDGEFLFALDDEVPSSPEEIVTRVRLPVQRTRRGKFVPDMRHASARTMPGLVGEDRLSVHSSKQAIRWSGEDDPHALCGDALEDAENIVGLRSSRILDLTELELPERIDALRQQWFLACEDPMGPIPLHLPPLREINHEINLVDEGAVYNYHMPRCPDALRPQLREKINRYVSAGWWEMKPVP